LVLQHRARGYCSERPITPIQGVKLYGRNVSAVEPIAAAGICVLVRVSTFAHESGDDEDASARKPLVRKFPVMVREVAAVTAGTVA